MEDYLSQLNALYNTLLGKEDLTEKELELIRCTKRAIVDIWWEDECRKYGI
jgi:hypothetical protein